MEGSLGGDQHQVTNNNEQSLGVVTLLYRLAHVLFPLKHFGRSQPAEEAKNGG